MGASLRQPCRVYEEGLRVVKYFQRGGRGVKLIPLLLIDVTRRRSFPANSVAAAAVIRRRVQALSELLGVKRTQAVC